MSLLQLFRGEPRGPPQPPNWLPLALHDEVAECAAYKRMKFGYIDNLVVESQAYQETPPGVLICAAFSVPAGV